LYPPLCLFRLIAVSFSLALVPPAVLAGELCGRVLDPSGAVVPGAFVTIHARATPASLKTVSGPGGDFCVHRLSAGGYLAEASAPGFAESAAVEVVLDGQDKALLDLSLTLAQVTSRISVTASGSAQTTDEVQKAFDIVDRGEIERRAEFSLPEALRLVPGLRVQQNGGPGALTSIHIRGMRSFDTSILLDGFRFRDAAAPQGEGGGFLAEMFLVNAERLEVLRGSGSSLYGTHAIGGVLNVVTDPGGGPLRGELDAEGGGLGLVRGGAKFAGSAHRERLLFSAGAAHMNVTRGIDGDDRARNATGHGFLQYRLGNSSRLSARLFASDSFLQLNDSPFAAPIGNLPPLGVVPAIAHVTFVPSANDPDDRRAARHFSGMAAFARQLGSHASFRAAYQGVATRRVSRDGPGGNYFEPLFNSEYSYDGRVDLLEARTDIQAGPRHFISAGYEFERESYGALSADEDPDPFQRTNARAEAAQRSHSLFAQNQTRLFGERLLLAVSGRFQKFQLRQPRFAGGPPAYSGLRLDAPPNAYTGDAAIAYFFPRSGAKLRAHGGNGYRAPSLFERLGASFFFGAFSPYGDPRLNPERSIAVDGGIDQYLFSNRLRVGGTYFYTRLQEVIIFDFSGIINPATDPYGRFGGYRNTGGGLARGVEIELEATPYSSLRLKSSYTFTNARDRVSSTIDGSLRSFNIPEHMFTLLATQRFGRRFDVTFDLIAAGSYHFPLFTGIGSRAFRFNGPVKGDLVLSYSRPLSDTRSLRLFTRIENVFNRTYYEGGFHTPGAWATAGLKLHF
jgi:vitamin B12 transporter